MNKKEFEVELQKIADVDAAYFCVPFDPVQEYGKKNHIKVKALIDGELYRGSLVNMGSGLMLGVTQAIRKKIHKNPGDTVHIVLELDNEERIVEIPPDVEQVFGKNPEAAAYFSTLAYSHRKEYITWIVSAKKEETRLSRLVKMIEMLLKKKKNPSEK
jgi:hypothetical protein